MLWRNWRELDKEMWRKEEENNEREIDGNDWWIVENEKWKYDVQLKPMTLLNMWKLLKLNW